LIRLKYCRHFVLSGLTAVQTVPQAGTRFLYSHFQPTVCVHSRAAFYYHRSTVPTI